MDRERHHCVHVEAPHISHLHVRIVITAAARSVAIVVCEAGARAVPAARGRATAARRRHIHDEATPHEAVSAGARELAQICKLILHATAAAAASATAAGAAAAADTAAAASFTTTTTTTTTDDAIATTTTRTSGVDGAASCGKALRAR